MSDPIRPLSRPAVVTQRRFGETSHLTAAAVRHASEAIVLLDIDGRIMSVNPAFIRMTAYSENQACGMTLDEVLHQPADHRRDSFFQGIVGEAMEEGKGHWEGRGWVRRANGFNFPAFLTLDAVQDEGDRVTSYVTGFTDISERLQCEKRLSELELRDGSTGLANRSLLTERTNQALLQAERYGRSLGMLCICLDEVRDQSSNDLAHDELLKLVAQQLVASVRASDTVARITQNEFVVLLPEVEDADHVSLVAAKIAKSLDELLAFNVVASIGVARYPTDAQDMPGLLRHADADRFRSKPRLLSSV